MEWIIIAWWYGTRMLPLSKIIAKEMMPIWDKPVIQYIVEWLVWSWVTEIKILTTWKKSIIKKRFTKDKEIENILIQKWKNDLLEKLVNPRKIAKYQFIKQEWRLWTWWAILQLQKIIKWKYFFINFWDAIFDYKYFKIMLNKFKETNCPIIWIIPQPIKEASNHWVVKLNWEKLIEIEESRKIDKAPSNYIRDGFCILPYRIFEILKKIKKEKNWQKFRLADWINKLVKETDIYTVKIKWYRDIWNINKRMKANNKVYKDWSLF